jgi:microcystin-dependent protein
MAEPFIGEIRMFGGNFAPAGWALCNGALLSISENDALFALIGTTYGGDGQTTFGLPDLRGRVPVHMGAGYIIGQAGGVEQVTLVTNQLPGHTHAANASLNTGTSTTDPTGAYWSRDPGGRIPPYRTPSDTSMSSVALAASGGSQPHNNMQPSLALNFIISLFGIFPTQS